MERRLAAILAADVVGYSRLMNEDEEGTLARLDAFATEVIQPTIADHNGRLIKEMGGTISYQEREDAAGACFEILLHAVPANDVTGQ